MSTAEKTPDTITGTALPTFDPSKAAAEFRAAAEKVSESVEFGSPVSIAQVELLHALP
ncbi:MULTISPECIES: hypothetical protein [unclassified Mesorhizobium]|uniref:hypothetical protein n=1 Tax=unclassified Mesorhizobium TaxID=325217 RepID=UPI0016782C14|nr:MULTISPECIES: hypothetical protein [unclassified Mesorhizobium]